MSYSTLIPEIIKDIVIQPQSDVSVILAAVTELDKFRVVAKSGDLVTNTHLNKLEL